VFVSAGDDPNGTAPPSATSKERQYGTLSVCSAQAANGASASGRVMGNVEKRGVARRRIGFFTMQRLGSVFAACARTAG
jgi:hypothetical protein